MILKTQIRAHAHFAACNLQRQRRLVIRRSVSYEGNAGLRALAFRRPEAFERFPAFLFKFVLNGHVLLADKSFNARYLY